MSNTVDNRIVQMGFENEKFEKGVATTVKSLDELKKGLQLNESAQSLTNLETKAKGFSLQNISEGVENVSSKFSAFGVIGFTVLQNLTNAAINYGRKLVAAITEPMRTGFQEYETQMNAVQTVLANTASKGTTLSDVNEALNELNTYADKTIYNFTEMTRNIGTFTAAGVDLNTSVAAIKGIANLAAVSGSNSQQAATAMYQLSQALSSGTVKLMDWNSVVNAGMGGQVFQDALKETARVHGVAIDSMIDKEGSFRETLSNGWLTSEVLLDTLQKFTGDLSKEQLLSMGYAEDQIEAIMKLGVTANDAATKVKTYTQLIDTVKEALQSGWTQSWQLIIGDFEEAKELFTWISDTLGAMISDSANARNKILTAWKSAGGRAKLIDSLKNAFTGFLRIVKPIKLAFTEIFGKGLNWTHLVRLTNAVHAFSEKLKIGVPVMRKIKSIFKGLFSVLDIVRMLLVTLGGALWDFIKGLDFSKVGILDFLANIGDWLTNLRNVIKVNDTFGVGLQKVKEALNNAALAVVDFFDRVKKKLGPVGEAISNFFSRFKKPDVDFSGVGKGLGKIRVNFSPLNKMMDKIRDGMKRVSEFMSEVKEKISDFAHDRLDIAGGLYSSIATKLKSLDPKLVVDAIKIALTAISTLSARKFFQTATKGVDNVGDIFENVGGIFDGIKKGITEGIFGGITGILDSVRGSVEAWQQNIKAKTLLTIAGAIAILTASLIALTLVDSKKLIFATGAVTAMFADLTGSMALINKTGGFSGGVAGSLSLVAMATAILILAGALTKVSKIDPIDAQNGLLAIAAMTTGLVLVSKVLSKEAGGLIKGSIGLAIFSASLLILVQVVKSISKLKPEELTTGLTGVGIMLAEIAAFLKLSDMGKMGVMKGLSLIALAGAIIVMALAVERFGQMDQSKVQQGLMALGAVLAEVALFTRLTGKGGNIVTASIGMTLFSSSMLIFAQAAEKLGNLSVDQIAKGLGTMAGALTLIFLAAKAMPKDMILTGLALVVVSSALVIMADAIDSMSDMTWEEIGRGLTVMAGALLILTLALMGMSGTIGGSAALLVAVGALTLLVPVLKVLGQMSLAEIGTALLALAGVFVVLGIAGAALTPLIPSLFGIAGALLLLGAAAALVGIGLLAFSAGLAALAVSGAAGAAAIVAFVAAILSIIPMVITALVGGLILFAKLIIQAIPAVAEAITKLLLAFLQIIIDTTPKLMETLGVLLDALIELIREKIPDFIEAILDLIGTLLEQLADHVPDFIQSGFDILIGFLEGIRDNIGEVVTVAIDIVTEFIDAVAEKLPDVIDSGWNLIISFIDGLAASIEENGGDLRAAVGRLADAVVQGFTDGLTSGVGGVVSAIGRLGGAAVDALKTLLGIFSPSRVFSKLGEYVPLGFAKGILKLAHRVGSATKDVGKKAISGMSNAIATINDSLVNGMDMNPTIRPVMDLSEVVAGTKDISDLLSQQVDVASALSSASIVAGGIPGNIDIWGRSLQESNNGGIKFEQNNYSPKALSRIEIYRQTRNQLSQLKGVIGNDK